MQLYVTGTLCSNEQLKIKPDNKDVKCNLLNDRHLHKADATIA